MATTRTKPITTLPRIGPRSAGVFMTPEEFDAVTDYDDRFRYELIRGVLVVTPIPAEGESDPNEELGYLLRTFRDTHPQEGALDATMPERHVVIGGDRRRADRVIWAGLGRTPDPRKDVPTIVVEFVSKSRRDFARDYEVKRAEYLAAGVAEYWIIDRFRRTMAVYRPTPGGLGSEQVVREGETFRTDRLPGFELPLARLLAVADRWAPPKPARRSRPRQGRRDQTDG
jgi:Uma2 family endonuclease